MKCEFTRHFWEKWNDRKDTFLKEGVNVNIIVEFALNPDLTLPDDVFPKREWRIKRVGNRRLKIVVEVEEDRLIIITAYFDRTFRRKSYADKVYTRDGYLAHKA